MHTRACRCEKDNPVQRSILDATYVHGAATCKRTKLYDDRKMEAGEPNDALTRP